MASILLILFIIGVTAGNIKKYDLPNNQYIPKVSRLTPKEDIAVNHLKIHNSDISPYIDGGAEVDPPFNHPYLAVVTIDYTYSCNGVLLSDEWVLTTAQCLVGGYAANVLLGNHDLNVYETTEESSFTSQFTIHENYDNNTLENNIALVQFVNPIILTDAVNTIALPSVNDKDLGEGIDVTIVGWGGESFTGPNLVYDVTVPTITNTECANVYGSEVQEGKLCTSHENGGASSVVDLGSPVVYEAPIGPQLRGIVSSVSRIEGRYPDVHTRITHYLDWIHEKTGL